CRDSLVEENDISVDGGAGESSQLDDLFARLPTLAELERHYIGYVLAHTQGRKEEAAQILGVNRKTLYRKEREYGVESNRGLTTASSPQKVPSASTPASA
ncbi:MAG TPA: helix-turn-helix domain-containing protein, partial [Bdellovibrionota bacterium]|nr:helix-turn-helix domain-containing protein [Bdellovibrionota bacterium]